jgi:o-succinylbenzoate synthase
MADQVHLIKRQFRKIGIRYWNLQFLRPAKTSKSTLQEHRVLYLFGVDENGLEHWGEIAPLTHLSKEKVEDCALWVNKWWDDQVGFDDLPSSVKFGLEGLINPLVQNKENHRSMLINGLVWMNDVEAMYHEASAKLRSGFDCIKIKVGALDFDAECKLIQKLRNEFGTDFSLRLDANGAWKEEEALEKLNILSQYKVHSVEQPIAPGQWEKMAKVVRDSPISIALDEELIDVSLEERRQMLLTIQPHYIVIKPTLHGGFSSSDDWIERASEMNIQWWATSALESNIGLGHIYQWLLNYETKLPQGLGTGSLYSNNWNSPLEMRGQMMSWNEDKEWSAPWI